MEYKEPKLFGPENDLLRYFKGPKHRGAGATSGLDPADADFIQAVLERYSLGDIVTVDRSRLRESHEAWVHIIVEGTEPTRSSNLSGLRSVPKAWSAHMAEQRLMFHCYRNG